MVAALLAVPAPAQDPELEPLLLRIRETEPAAELEASSLQFVRLPLGFTVRDPEGLTDTSSFDSGAAGTFTPVNDGPTIDTNALAVTEGGTTVLDTSMLSSSDPDHAAGDLTYTVDSATAGTFKLSQILPQRK